MRIASFNVENFFDRAKALNTESWAEGKPILAAQAELNALIEEPAYSEQQKTRIVELLDVLGLTRSDAAQYAVLRQVRGHLVKRPRSGGVEVVANGRTDWVGWVELTTEPVTEAAVGNTARVVADVGADILGVVEAENRIVLKHFADAQLLDATAAALYPQIMLIDGNDDRGIDVAILTRPGWSLGSIRTHVDDTDADGVIFSRTAPSTRYARPAATASSCW